MNSGKLLLTSTGLSSETVVKTFLDITNDIKSKSVAIITTAAEDKEKDKYSQLSKQQLIKIGFSDIDFVDFEAESQKDLSKYEIIYVVGGNTFKLLKFARIANFGLSIKKLLQRDGIYVGVSAGSSIVGPSIQIAGEIEPDPNDVGLEDFTGLNITELIILPHYTIEIEKETKEFEIRHNVKVERISDSQAILVENGQKIIIG